jgi:hypothetical protein
MTTSQIQTVSAEILGTEAFNKGMKRICAFDSDLSKLMIGRNVGETPKGEASSISIMKHWYTGWDNANLYGSKLN